MSSQLKQTLKVDVPPNEWLSANMRFGHYAVRAKRVAALRARSKLLARAARLRPMNGLVHVSAVVIGRQNRRSDPNNAADATKAIVDGLRDAGVLVDDDHLHVLGPDHRHGDTDPSLRVGWHRIVLELEEAGGVVSAAS